VVLQHGGSLLLAEAIKFLSIYEYYKLAVVPWHLDVENYITALYVAMMDCTTVRSFSLRGDLKMYGIQLYGVQ